MSWTEHACGRMVVEPVSVFLFGIQVGDINDPWDVFDTGNVTNSGVTQCSTVV